MAVSKDVKGFATAAFVLLGILFGMMIMTFIFGQLGNTAVTTIADETNNKVNVTGAYINATTYTIPEASDSNFVGSFTVVQALNNSDDGIILSGNYTVDATAGTLVNASALLWDNVSLTYSYVQKTSAKQATETTQNNSLQGIVSYTGQTSTQFTTLAIAITLIILVAIFLLFWKVFGGSGKKKGMVVG